MVPDVSTIRSNATAFLGIIQKLPCCLNGITTFNFKGHNCPSPFIDPTKFTEHN